MSLRTVDCPADRRRIAFHDDRLVRRLLGLLPLAHELIQLEPRFGKTADQIELGAFGRVELLPPLLKLVLHGRDHRGQHVALEAAAGGLLLQVLNLVGRLEHVAP